jgi:hypothetical protein
MPQPTCCIAAHMDARSAARPPSTRHTAGSNLDCSPPPPQQLVGHLLRRCAATLFRLPPTSIQAPTGSRRHRAWATTSSTSGKWRHRRLQEIKRQGGQRRHLRCVPSLSVLSAVLSTERLIERLIPALLPPIDSMLWFFYSIWILKFAYEKIKGTHPLDLLTARPSIYCQAHRSSRFLDVFSSWWLLISFNSNPVFPISEKS